MGGKLKMAGAPRTPAAHERETVVSSIPPNEHGHVTFLPAAAQQMQMSPQEPTRTQKLPFVCALLSLNILIGVLI